MMSTSSKISRSPAPLRLILEGKGLGRYIMRLSQAGAQFTEEEYRWMKEKGGLPVLEEGTSNSNGNTGKTDDAKDDLPDVAESTDVDQES